MLLKVRIVVAFGEDEWKDVNEALGLWIMYFLLTWLSQLQSVFNAVHL